MGNVDWEFYFWTIPTGKGPFELMVRFAKSSVRPSYEQWKNLVTKNYNYYKKVVAFLYKFYFPFIWLKFQYKKVLRNPIKCLKIQTYFLLAKFYHLKLKKNEWIKSCLSLQWKKINKLITHSHSASHMFYKPEPSTGFKLQQNQTDHGTKFHQRYWVWIWLFLLTTHHYHIRKRSSEPQGASSTAKVRFKLYVWGEISCRGPSDFAVLMSDFCICVACQYSTQIQTQCLWWNFVPWSVWFCCNLNPVELVWAYMKRFSRKRLCASVAEQRKAVQDFWKHDHDARVLRKIRVPTEKSNHKKKRRVVKLLIFFKFFSFFSK
jgi:hypothetical protein